MLIDRWVLATGNADKAREIGEVFSAQFDVVLALLPVNAVRDDALVGFVVVDPASGDFDATSLPIVVDAPNVEETGATLVENARIKATAVATATGLPTIADDTGLAVDALGGEPGVYSARYAGDDATYDDNVRKLLAELARVGARERAARTARFSTVAMVRWPDGRELGCEGTVEGFIAAEARGPGGFGYDPVFVPDELDGRTFAELRVEEKHSISHRGRAFRSLGEVLRHRGDV